MHEDHLVKYKIKYLINVVHIRYGYVSALCLQCPLVAHGFK